MAFEAPRVLFNNAVHGDTGPVAVPAVSGFLPIPAGTLLNLQAHALGTAGDTLDITLQWSMDGSTFIANSTPDTMTQLTDALTDTFKSFPVRAPYFQAAFAVGADTDAFSNVKLTMWVS